MTYFYIPWSKGIFFLYDKGLNIGSSNIRDLCMRLVGRGNMSTITENHERACTKVLFLGKVDLRFFSF
jgi:hypothetical protein